MKNHAGLLGYLVKRRGKSAARRIAQNMHIRQIEHERLRRVIQACGVAAHVGRQGKPRAAAHDRKAVIAQMPTY